MPFVQCVGLLIDALHTREFNAVRPNNSLPLPTNAVRLAAKQIISSSICDKDSLPGPVRAQSINQRLAKVASALHIGGLLGGACRMLSAVICALLLGNSDGQKAKAARQRPNRRE